MNENMNKVPTPKVTAKITWINSDSTGAKKASANITIADSFIVHGLSIVEGPKGLFLSMPQRASDRDGERKFLEIAHPVTADMRKAITDAVFDAYSNTMAISQQYQGAHIDRSGSAEPVESFESDESNLPFDLDSDTLGEPSEPVMGMVM